MCKITVRRKFIDDMGVGLEVYVGNDLAHFLKITDYTIHADSAYEETSKTINNLEIAAGGWVLEHFPTYVRVWSPTTTLVYQPSIG